MKDYKIKVLNEMLKKAEENHAISIKESANKVGIKHLKTQDVQEILNAFIKARPEYKIYRLNDNPLASLFCSAFVSDNETFPVEATK